MLLTKKLLRNNQNMEELSIKYSQLKVLNTQKFPKFLRLIIKLNFNNRKYQSSQDMLRGQYLKNYNISKLAQILTL